MKIPRSLMVGRKSSLNYQERDSATLAFLKHVVLPECCLPLPPPQRFREGKENQIPEGLAP